MAGQTKDSNEGTVLLKECACSSPAVSTPRSRTSPESSRPSRAGGNLPPARIFATASYDNDELPNAKTASSQVQSSLPTVATIWKTKRSLDQMTDQVRLEASARFATDKAIYVLNYSCDRATGEILKVSTYEKDGSRRPIQSPARMRIDAGIPDTMVLRKGTPVNTAMDSLRSSRCLAPAPLEFG